ncbi:hypothetical protein Tco_1425271, partial [Tanacetum coccineum]
MDENTVRLWLKNHKDTVKKLAQQQQQATAFQAQFDTLRAARAATKSAGAG